jgi:hypothetical protein
MSSWIGLILAEAGTRVYLTVDAVGVADPGADLTVFLYR